MHAMFFGIFVWIPVAILKFLPDIGIFLGFIFIANNSYEKLMIVIAYLIFSTIRSADSYFFKLDLGVIFLLDIAKKTLEPKNDYDNYDKLDTFDKSTNFRRKIDYLDSFNEIDVDAQNFHEKIEEMRGIVSKIILAVMVLWIVSDYFTLINAN
tara:strand:+ start:211 stop:669 length:459 start_codon:yes stop_codon:yes gene_type:complete